MLRALGAYDIESELGRGGMGRVYRARHRPTGVLRALKVLEGDAEPEQLERFRREAQLLARLGGGGAVAVHEVGAERGVAFYAMDLLPGGTLRDRIRARTRLPWREAAALVAALARTLAACHAGGVIHRDVKPENVLFDEEGAPRLADFGLARDLSARSLTATGTLVGTAAYMAPEQVDAKAVTAATDVFALGVVLHELVTGERPYAGDAPHEVIVKALREERRPLSAFAEAPAGLERLVGRALAAASARRPSAAELAASLDSLLAGDVKDRDAAARRRQLRGALGASALVLVAASAAVARSLQGGASVPLDVAAVASTSRSVPAPPPQPPPPVSDLPEDLDVREACTLLAERQTDAGLARVAASKAASARTLVATHDAAVAYVEAFEDPVARTAATAALSGQLARLAASGHIAAARGLLAPLDALAEDRCAAYYSNPSETGAQDPEKLTSLRDALEPVPLEAFVPAKAVVTFIFAQRELRDATKRPTAAIAAELLGIGRTGAVLLETDPLLGATLIERTASHLHGSFDGPPAVEVDLWLEAALGHEDALIQAATSAPGSRFPDVRRWLHREHAFFERRLAEHAGLAVERRLHVERALDAKMRQIGMAESGGQRASDLRLESAALAVALGDDARASELVPGDVARDLVMALIALEAGDAAKALDLAKPYLIAEGQLASTARGVVVAAEIALRRAEARAELDRYEGDRQRAMTLYGFEPEELRRELDAAGPR